VDKFMDEIRGRWLPLSTRTSCSTFWFQTKPSLGHRSPRLGRHPIKGHWLSAIWLRGAWYSLRLVARVRPLCRGERNPRGTALASRTLPRGTDLAGVPQKKAGRGPGFWRTSLTLARPGAGRPLAVERPRILSRPVSGIEGDGPERHRV